MTENINNPFFEKPWHNDGFYKTYREADQRREILKDEEDLQVKVKKLSDRFVVKTRSVKLVEKKTKNKDKNANRRSKHTAETKADKRRNRKSRQSF
jgi:predicted double-glycine peptidase